MKLLRNVSTLVLCLTAGVAIALAADPSGTWKFTAQGPGGRGGDATLTLAYAGDRLTGTLENRAGKVSIADATFANDEISFRVHREVGRRLRKKSVEVQYRGKLAGDTITGTIQAGGGKREPVTLPWEAHRVK